MKDTLKQSKIIFQENNKFNKPNITINISKNRELSLKDKKVYNVLLRKLLDQDINDYESGIIKTSITQICYELGIKNRTDIVDSLNKLQQTFLRFDHTDENGDVLRWDTTFITGQGVYKRREDSVVIEFSKILTKEILLHSTRYTKIDLIEMNRLKVGHSLSIYELIKSKLFKYKYQYQNYTEEELRNYLNLQDKYKNIKQFNQKVIRTIINDINLHTELDLTLLKQSKSDKGRTYHFQVKYEDLNIDEKSFIKTLKTINTKYFKEITFKNGNRSYYLGNNSDYGNEKDITNLYWINSKTDKTVSTDLAEFIYEELYKQFRNDTMNFIEDKIGIDINEWIEIERDYLE